MHGKNYNDIDNNIVNINKVMGAATRMHTRA